MSSPQENLAHALETLKALQKKGCVAIRSKDLSRTDRERLLRAGFLQSVIKGWYIPSRPEENLPGETTAWYASFWSFCATYLDYRFGADWSLSPDQSVLIHAGNRTVPPQLLVRSPNARNKVTELAHGTSIFEVRARVAKDDEIEVIEGLRVFKLPQALVHCGPRLFTSHPTDARAALALFRDASELLPVLLTGGHSVIAGRLAGAIRNIGRQRISDNIVKSMRSAGYTVSVTDPFDDDHRVLLPSRERSPYINRLHTLWQSMHQEIEKIFPNPPPKRMPIRAYLKQVDDIYVTDAYHSLSIEGYRVSESLIERVRQGDWDPERLDTDRQQRDAMAARGYWLAFQAVKKSVQRVLEGKNPGEVADEDHAEWYRALFGPSVEAGLLTASDLAGYRNAQVFIRNSMHVPLRREAVLDCMPVLFERLRDEKHPGVRAVMGHFIFVYIHPYMDGNGRMGRFLMNLMLASGGYGWTVVPMERRNEYMAALEKASVHGQIDPFARFLGSLCKDR